MNRKSYTTDWHSNLPGALAAEVAARVIPVAHRIPDYELARVEAGSANVELRAICRRMKTRLKEPIMIRLTFGGRVDLLIETALPGKQAELEFSETIDILRNRISQLLVCNVEGKHGFSTDQYDPAPFDVIAEALDAMQDKELCWKSAHRGVNWQMSTFAGWLSTDMDPRIEAFAYVEVQDIKETYSAIRTQVTVFQPDGGSEELDTALELKLCDYLKHASKMKVI